MVGPPARRPGVCLITETYYPVVGGGETQARLLAGGLTSAGFSVLVLTRRSDASLPRVEQVDDVTVYRLWPVGRGRLKKWGLLLSAFPKLMQLAHKYDLIFVSGFRIVGMAAVLASKLLGKACVLKADSQGEMSGAFFRAGLARLRLHTRHFPFRAFLFIRNGILRHADAFAAITEDIGREMTDAGISQRLIHMIPNGVDTARFTPVAREQKDSLRYMLGLPLSSKIVIYTGRLVSYKGLPMLVRAWQKLRNRHDDAYLLLVGKGGLDMHNCEAELKDFVAKNDLQGSVHFTGSVSNVHAYLQASDIFVFPTEDDAFPSSIVEAMSCRLPVIATPVGAISTIVADGQSGILFQPGDFEGLLRALETLLSDEALADAFGEAGRESVKCRFSSEVVNKRYIELFRSVGQGRGLWST